jgi:hypothetical protein
VTIATATHHLHRFDEDVNSNEIIDFDIVDKMDRRLYP